MSTLLTYVLAALAVAVLVFLIGRPLVPIALGWASEGVTPTFSLAAFIPIFGATLATGTSCWTAMNMFMRHSGKRAVTWFLGRGVGAGVLGAAAASALMVGYIGILAGGLDLSALPAFANLFVRLGVVSIPFGLVWGTVFWLRAPKPQTAGIAA